jgi:NAD(P)-dependent dehydrogenase (short-subunit alcohol dehydrogenase family)
MAPPFHAIISGAGSGTGRSLALRFATAYSVVLLSRNPSTVSPLVDEVRAAGGSALGIAADASDPASMDRVLEQVAAELPGSRLAAAVYNANAGFAFKPFLEMTEQDLDTSLGTGA